MSNPRSLTIATLKTTTEIVLEVDLLFFANKGYVVNVQPMKKTTEPCIDGSGRTMTTCAFECFTNKSALVETAKRFNAKRLAALAANPDVRDTYERLAGEIALRDKLVFA